MDRAECNRPQLPRGWYYPDAETAASLGDEFRKELPAGHLLDGDDVEVFAWREGATDDVLFRHKNERDRFTVIHLTWSGRMQSDTQHPWVECDGSFADFLRYEERWLRPRKP